MAVPRSWEMVTAVTRPTEISSFSRGARILRGGQASFEGFHWMSSWGTTKLKGEPFPWSVGDDALPDFAPPAADAASTTGDRAASSGEAATTSTPATKGKDDRGNR